MGLVSRPATRDRWPNTKFLRLPQNANALPVTACKSDSPGQTPPGGAGTAFGAVPSSAHPVLKIYTAGKSVTALLVRSGTDIIAGLYHSDTILVSHLAVFICVSTKLLATQG